MFEKMKAYCKAVMMNMKARGHEALEGTAAEAYVDTGVKILIAVVIGALLLALLYALFNTTVRESLNNAISKMFSKGDAEIDNVGL